MTNNTNNATAEQGSIASRIIQGDCLSVLPTLPSACIDAIITDPPYLGRYKIRTGRMLANDDKPTAVVGVYAELYRVLKPNGTEISPRGI
jgi:adenine-specific DNA-methyltransferase